MTHIIEPHWIYWLGVVGNMSEYLGFIVTFITLGLLIYFLVFFLYYIDAYTQEKKNVIKENFKINDPTNDNQLIYALKLLKAS